MRVADCLLDIELTDPAQASGRGGRRALAAILRREGAAIGFWLRTDRDAAAFSEARLSPRIGVDLVCDAVLAELAQRAAPPPSPSAAVFVTIAVCTRDRPDQLATCLQALTAAVARAEPARAELLVIDNAPADDRTQHLVAQVVQVRYVREPRGGLDFARNRALAEARGTWVAFVDDDVLVDAEWVRTFERLASEPDEVAAVTGQVLPLELASEAQHEFELRGGFRQAFRRRRLGPLEPQRAGHSLTAWTFGTGANFAVRRDVARALGGFDEALDTPALPAGGDLDMLGRIARAGHQLLYEPRLLARHRHRRERAALRAQLRSWGAGTMALWSKAYARDRALRAALRRYLARWSGERTRDLLWSASGRSELPLDLVLAEIAGGLRGLAAEYPRSQRRVTRESRE